MLRWIHPRPRWALRSVCVFGENVAAFELRHFDDVVSLGRTDFDVGPRILVRNVTALADGRHGTIHYTWQAGTGTGTIIARNVGTPAACVVFDPG